VKSVVIVFRNAHGQKGLVRPLYYRSSRYSPLVWPGRVNALTQTLLKLTAPGVPDFYQGTELWNVMLVDPDNRQPVDYVLRNRLLAELQDLSIKQVIARAEEGLPKLWLIQRTLQLRKRHPQWFGLDGYYHPLYARGSRASHVIAFSRGSGVIAIAPRLPISLDGDWGRTAIHLPEGSWLNELTDERTAGGEVLLANLLSEFPVCLLSREEPNQ
jgi:(1->4)-alpha-D-glucan 1-alpha-D-glucosylmutase